MAVVLNVTTFAEYAASGRHRRTEIVTTQSADDFRGRFFYQPILDAIRQAAVAPDPTPVLAEAIARADLTGQHRAYTEIAAGFLAWWRRTHAIPLRPRTTTLRIADLDLTVTPHLAIHPHPRSTTLTTTANAQIVLFYLKEPPLPRDASSAALRILQICQPDLLPNATPLVVDLRRAREHRLPHNTNPTTLDAWLTAEAAAYTTHQSTL
ncbi:hypothetical protein [Actinokineospora sp.]|uniref:hypothetical protein n=1 Tax=Actinokineospora sp. TaxID=1872133 RepID=UPI0040382F53